MSKYVSWRCLDCKATITNTDNTSPKDIGCGICGSKKFIRIVEQLPPEAAQKGEQE